MEAEMEPKRYILFQIKCPHLLTDRTTPTPFIAHARKVRDVKFQENRSNGRRDTNEIVILFQAKCH
jgi:hypothetical protein